MLKLLTCGLIYYTYSIENHLLYTTQKQSKHEGMKFKQLLLIKKLRALRI